MRLILVPKKKAMSLIPQIDGVIYYYLHDDYAYFLELKRKLGQNVEIRTLSGIFDNTFQEIKAPFLEIVAELNKNNNLLHWWGSELATSNTASVAPLLHNITYLFCAKKLLASISTEIGFITDNSALSESINIIAKDAGYHVYNYQNKGDRYKDKIKLWFHYMYRILRFLKEAFQRRKAAFKRLESLSPKKSSNLQKRIIIRSWFSEGNLNKQNRCYKDRNFGPLPEWLRSKGYEIWTCPMFFNLSSSIEDVYSFMNDQEHSFIIPEHYLKLSDYLVALYESYKIHNAKIGKVEIQGIDLTPLFYDLLNRQKFNTGLLILNLADPMLKRLQEKEFEIDGFYYAFENNAPEKVFILSCRKYFPDVKIIAFQHTTFFPNNLAYHLAPGEKEYHPLPDKIICSGPIYVTLHEKAGFPHEILKSGPNLRFGSVHEELTNSQQIDSFPKKSILLPLSWSYDLAYELFVKVKEAVENNKEYKFYIRNHPLLSKKQLITFLKQIEWNNYEFADDGSIQEWLPKTHAMILTGGSITVLEAVAMGTPVIRVIPDNDFSYDTFAGADYPLDPVNTVVEIKKQLQIIEHLLDKDRDTFSKIAKRILPQYFSKPTEKNLKLFL